MWSTSSLALLSLIGNAVALQETYVGGPTFDITYDQYTEKIKFEVNDLPKDTYLAIGFSEFMSVSDMVMFSGAEGGSVTDLFSTSAYYGPPSVDMSQDYTWTVI